MVNVVEQHFVFCLVCVLCRLAGTVVIIAPSPSTKNVRAINKSHSSMNNLVAIQKKSHVGLPQAISEEFCPDPPQIPQRCVKYQAL